MGNVLALQAGGPEFNHHYPCENASVNLELGKQRQESPWSLLSSQSNLLGEL